MARATSTWFKGLRGSSAGYEYEGTYEGTSLSSLEAEVLAPSHARRMFRAVSFNGASRESRFE